MDRVSLGHYVIGMEGVALLRTYLGAHKEKAQERIAEIRTFVNAPDRPPLALQFEVPEVDVGRGYAAWSTTYDTAPNPLISLEEPAVHTLIDSLLAGKALDAACGTGRRWKHGVCYDISTPSQCLFAGFSGCGVGSAAVS